MVRLTEREWRRAYRYWRVPYAHLAPVERQRMVRGCKGKAQYYTADEAIADARLLPIRSDDKRWLKAYRCPLCQNWHIGNTKWPQNGFVVRRKPR